MHGKLNEGCINYLFDCIQHGTMRAAADALNLAPSAISRQIAFLKEEVGLTLIERHTRGVKPTEACTLLLDYFREQLSHREDLLSLLEELRGLRRGNVRIALGEGFVSDLMVGQLAKFGSDYRDISVILDVGGTNEVTRRVIEDEAEIGLILNPPPDVKIVSRAVSRQAILAIVGRDFPLLGKQGPFKIANFLPYPLALNHHTFGSRQILEVVERTEKIKLTPILTTNSFKILKQFVKLQLGVTFLPTFVVRNELEEGELFAIPIQQPILEIAEAHLITRTG